MNVMKSLERALKLGISRKEIAKAVGVSTAAVDNWLHSDNGISPKNAHKLEQYLAGVFQTPVVHVPQVEVAGSVEQFMESASQMVAEHKAYRATLAKIHRMIGEVLYGEGN